MHRYQDPVTGRPVTRLTDLTEHCHHPYFYNRCFTADSRRALLVARLPTGPEVRLVDVATGEVEPLVAGAGIGEFMVTLTPDDRYLYYGQGQELRRFDLRARRDEVIWRQEPPWDGNFVYPGYSDDYRLALLAQLHRDDAVPKGEGWDFFLPQWEAQPRCRLVLLDLETGAERVVREEACWLGHPQIRPGDPDTLLYCHEGPGNRVDARMWLVQADGTRNRCVGYRELHPGAGPADYITHECFLPAVDGAPSESLVYLRLPRAAEPVEVRLRRVVDLSLARRFEVSGYLHVGPAPDARTLVGDERAADPAESCLWRLDLASGGEERLCRHGSSYACRGASTQDAHPHPSFAPDGRQVLFSSDRETGPTGPCAVYVVAAD